MKAEAKVLISVPSMRGHFPRNMGRASYPLSEFLFQSDAGDKRSQGGGRRKDRG